MHIFSDYIQPITEWLYIHPNWALLFTFLISLAESLAIIGSVVPGSVTMTAIGILAGSGVMRIDLTLIAATLGAVAGDGFSYLLGYTYSDKIMSIWPFTRYPEWLLYGKEFFSRHGGKSVLIGRFIGPLRSIIPVIAGMMHMSHLRFFLANLFSAIGWSLLYIMPGVFIGAASAELSSEAATRLFTFVLIFLGLIWLLGVLLKSLIRHIQRFLQANLHLIWSRLTHNPKLAALVKMLTPAKEVDHYQTAALFFSFLAALFLFLILTILVTTAIAKRVDLPVHLFIQSLRTGFLDGLFVVITEVINPINMSLLSFSVLAVFLHYQDWRKSKFWIYLNLCCSVVVLLSHWLVPSPYPTGLVSHLAGNSYPNAGLSFATAQLTSVSLYVSSLYLSRFSRIINTLMVLSLLVLGFAPLYLGENWLSDILGAYLLGLSLSLVHWMMYRKQANYISYPPRLAVFLLALLVMGTSISSILNYQQSLRSHQVYTAQYVLEEPLWWQQQQPILPLYRSNRIGKPVNFFNLQYLGSLEDLEAALMLFGWQPQKQTLMNSIIKRVSGNLLAKDSPIMAQLYLHKRPMLVMTYQVPGTQSMQVLKLWRSNYYVSDRSEVIWLGSVYNMTSKKLKPVSGVKPSLEYVRQALPSFQQRLLNLSIKQPKSLGQFVEPQILLLRDSFIGKTAVE